MTGEDVAFAARVVLALVLVASSVGKLIGAARALSVGSLVRNGWFLVLAVIATGAATMQEPSAAFATVLVAVAFGGVSAVLIVRT